MGRRIDIKADNIAKLLRKGGIIGELEMPVAVRGKAMGAPDALHRGDRQSGGFRHGRSRPMGGFVWRLFAGEHDDGIDPGLRQRRDAPGAGLVPQQAIDAFFCNPLPPQLNRPLGDTGLLGDAHQGQAFTAQKHDPRAPHVLLRAVPVADDRLKSAPISGCKRDDAWSAHTADSHNQRRPGIPSGDKCQI